MYNEKTFNKRQIYHGEEKPSNKDHIQMIRINGKEIKDKKSSVTYTEEVIPTEDPFKSRVNRYIDITIEKPPEDKKKKEEELKAWKNTMKKELLFTIGKLLKGIALSVSELEIQEFTKRNIIFPLATEKTYGITVDREKKQSLMINSLFDYFEEIDNLKGKDIPKVQKILKEVTDNIKGFVEKKPAPETKEGFKYKSEVKARQMGKTQETKDCIFAGIDFGKGPDVIHCVKVGMKDGKPYIEEI